MTRLNTAALIGLGALAGGVGTLLSGWAAYKLTRRSKPPKEKSDRNTGRESG